MCESHDSCAPRAQIPGFAQPLLQVVVWQFLVMSVSGCGSTDLGFDVERPYGLIPAGSAEHNFGQHRQEETLSHVFSLLNNTERPVRIVELRTSCTCTVAGRAESGSSTVPPGERVEIPVSLTTSGAQDVATGRVTVRYCDAEDQQSELRGEVAVAVRADILPDYRIIPATVDFGVIDGLTTQRVSRTVRIDPVAKSELHVTEARSTAEFLSCHISPGTDGRTGCLLDVTVDASGLSQDCDLNGLIIVSTNSERVPQASIRVHGRYAAPVSVEPRAVVISSAEQGVVRRGIRIRTVQPSRVLQAGAGTEDRIRVEWSAEQVGGEHLLHVDVSPCQETALNAELRVVVDVSGDVADGDVIRREVVVPVHRFE